jgi:predicted AlkP superfamily phosphohydrolase/phosphomutase
MKAMVIGLDAASPLLIDRWADHLPNIRSLCTTGVHGVLNSIVPPSSVPAWQCFATGKNPAKIGVWGFLSIGPDRKLRHARTTQDIGCIWDTCGNAGVKVGVFNVPGTFPPYPVNGFMVSGFPTPPGKAWAYPKEVMRRLDKAVDGYEVDVPLTKPSEMKGGEDAYLVQVERLHTKSVDSAKLLLEWYKPDLFVMTLQGIDLVQHDFSRYMNQPGSEHADVVRDWYVKIDQAVGELKKLATQDTTFLALSDHGSIPISSSFHVNEYLRSQGILRTNQTRERKNGDFYSGLRKLILRTLPPSAISTLYRVVPDSWSHRLTVSAQFERMLTQLVETIDWKNTKAFSTGGPQAAIFINSKDYDGGSLEDPGKRSELLQDLRNKLGNLVHPKTGERIRAVFHVREDTFKGPYRLEAPDLAVELFSQTEKIHINIKFGSGDLWSFAPHLSSEHVREGFWAMSGPGIRQNQVVDASILDMAPTLHKIFGLNTPDDVDGQVVQSIFEEHPLDPIPS